jgi:hypothetical protein
VRVERQNVPNTRRIKLVFDKIRSNGVVSRDFKQWLKEGVGTETDSLRLTASAKSSALLRENLAIKIFNRRVRLHNDTWLGSVNPATNLTPRPVLSTVRTAIFAI